MLPGDLALAGLTLAIILGVGIISWLADALDDLTRRTP